MCSKETAEARLLMKTQRSQLVVKSAMSNESERNFPTTSGTCSKRCSKDISKDCSKERSKECAMSKERFPTTSGVLHELNLLH